MKSFNVHSSLQEVLTEQGLNPEHLSVGLKTQSQRPDLSGREEVLVSDGEKTGLWTVSSLRGLFRGENEAPSMRGEPPQEYLPLFHFIERHMLVFCEAFGDQTDGQFEDAYRYLWRRPDGRSETPLHFFLWQVAAGLLGTRPLSDAEFTAILDRLKGSAGTFRMGASSRNYVNVLRQMP